MGRVIRYDTISLNLLDHGQQSEGKERGDGLVSRAMQYLKS